MRLSIVALVCLVGCAHALAVVHSRAVSNFATQRRCAATEQRRCALLRMDEANEANDADDDNLSPIQRMRKQYEEKPGTIVQSCTAATVNQERTRRIY